MESRLHTTRVTADGSSPTKWTLWLHGIFGSGQNFRSLARRFVAQHAEWGALLVDLRAHGDSPALAPPHTLAAAAGDVAAVAADLGAEAFGVIGHSFGGKVAMELVRTPSRPRLSQLVVLDSNPSPKPEGLTLEMAGKVLSLLEGMPWPLPSREAFLERITTAGYPMPIAQWLAMNVRRLEAGDYGLRVDLAAIRAMLQDYFATDTWETVDLARTDRGPTSIRFVLGGASSVVSGADKERLASLAGGAADDRVPVAVDELPSAGHWVHADDPTGTLDAIRRSFPAL